jgi:hypothetical protein
MEAVMENCTQFLKGIFRSAAAHDYTILKMRM